MSLMSYLDKLNPHTKSIWRWVAGAEAKRNAPPPNAAQQIWPSLPSGARAPVPEQRREGNVSAAAALYPNLKRRL
jgi:hypothetical protein